MLAFQTFSLHNALHLLPAEEFRRTVDAAGVGMVLLVMACSWSKSSFSHIWIGLIRLLVLLLEHLAQRA